MFAFLMIVSIGPYFAYSPRAGAPETDFKAQLDRSAPRILRHFGVPGVVITTIVNGSPSQTYAYGFADLERHTPMTTDTVFRVASLSKSLTSWGIMRLVQQGKVGLDRPAEQYLSAWPLARSAFPSKAVTVRELLSHTSGLNAGTDIFTRPDEPVPSALDVLQQEGSGPLAHPGPAKLIAPAGRAFVYSVPGYMILQAIIEHQSNEAFTDYMKAQVLRPLGMTSSSFQWDQILRSRTATPYTAGGKAIPVFVARDVAADSLFASAADIARFVAAPLPDKNLPSGAGVLNPEFVGDLYGETDQVPSLQLAGLGLDRPGLGYFIEHLPGGRVIVTNGGYDPGWSCRFYMAPSTGDGVAILTNSDGGPPVIAQIASIWSSWRGLPPSEMTKNYRTLGVEAAVALSLLVMLDISFALGLVFGVRSGSRKLGAFSLATLSASLLEVALSISVVLIWALAFAAVRTLPTIHAVGILSIGALLATVIARIALSEVAASGSGRRTGAA